MYRILMVCMGNICRSPTAHGVMRHLLAQQDWSGLVAVDSCGTHGYHIGEPPDPRSQQHARRRGYELSDLRARQVQAADFERFELILAMDTHNLSLLRQRCPAAQQHKLHLMTEYCSRHGNSGVPDPYYGGEAGFEHVLDLIEDACEGVVRALPAVGKKA